VERQIKTSFGNSFKEQGSIDYLNITGIGYRVNMETIKQNCNQLYCFRSKHRLPQISTDTRMMIQGRELFKVDFIDIKKIQDKLEKKRIKRRDDDDKVQASLPTKLINPTTNKELEN
jgi:hypothetical protein